MNISVEPLVSVIFPAHNGELYVRDAIQSILDQTYTNFEFIILISGRTNQESKDIINSFSDKRIKKIFCNPEYNLPITLNYGIAESKGKYIARMDADDISLPGRLKREVEFMESHPEVTIAGSWAKTFGAKENIINHPVNYEEIKVNLLFQTTLVHPTVIMRKEMMEKNNLYYNPECYTSEDFELWSRAVEKVVVVNIPEILLLYRTHDLQATHQNKDKQIAIRAEVLTRQLLDIGIVPVQREIQIHYMITKFQSEYTENFLNEIQVWLEKIISYNSRAKKYDISYLNKVTAEKWFVCCYVSASKVGFRSWRKFWQSKMSKSFQISPRNIVRLFKFFARSLV